jgi:hypothetical protein
MAYEDLPSQAWRNLPPAQWNTGLLGQGQAPTPTNYYQQIMQEMAAEPANVTGAPRSAVGYKPGIFAPRTVEEMVDELNALNAAGGRGGGRSAAEQQRIDQFFDAMTPTELAEFQKKNADFINKLLTPMPLQLADLAAKKLGYKGFLPYTLGGDIFTKEKEGIVTVGELSPAPTGGNVTPVTDGGLLNTREGIVTVGDLSPVTDGDGVTAPGDGVTSGGGLLGLSGVGAGPGVATTTPGNAVSSAMGGQAAAAGNVGRGGTSGVSGIGGPGVASTAPGNAVSSAMGGQAAAATGGGGGGGGGGGCCFIMLEARYGDGTMDRVVRRYRDEKVTEKNKRGYYKLAEVFIPLMRKSKLFSFFVVKTFADPAVCYAKWYYGENKWGWIFKPLEKFWMKLFDTLGTDTKFIRENGETV